MCASPAIDIRAMFFVVGLLAAISGAEIQAQPPTRPRTAPPFRWRPIMLREDYLPWCEVIIGPDVIFMVPVGEARSVRVKHAPLSAHVDNLGVAWIRWKSPRQIVLSGIIPRHTKLTIVYPSVVSGDELETIAYPVCVYTPKQSGNWRREFRVTEEP